MIARRRGIAIVVDEQQRVEGVRERGRPQPDDRARRRHHAHSSSHGDDDAIRRSRRVGELASAVAYRLEQHGIMAMPVVDDDERARRRRASARPPARAGHLMRTLVMLVARRAARWSRRLPRLESSRRSSPARAPPTAPTRCLFGMQYLLSTQGHSARRSPRRHGVRARRPDAVRPAPPHVSFTTETGAPQGTMEANRGVYNTQSQVLEGWGNVVVQLVDGRTLKSPHVIVQSDHAQISSDTNYTITRGNDTQSRHRVHVEPDVQHVHLSAQLHGQTSSCFPRNDRSLAAASRPAVCVAASRARARAAAAAQQGRRDVHVREPARFASTRFRGVGPGRVRRRRRRDPLPGARHHAPRRQRRALSRSRPCDRPRGVRRAAASRHVGLHDVLSARRASHRRRRTCMRAAQRIHARRPDRRVAPRASRGCGRGSRCSAIARPTITIVQKDSTGKTLRADRRSSANTVFMDGDSLIYGGGQVVITRTDINATADSASSTRRKETMHLMRNPQIVRQEGTAVHAQRRPDRPVLEEPQAARASSRARTRWRSAIR